MSNSLKCKNTGKLRVRDSSNLNAFLRCGSSANAGQTQGNTQNTVQDPVTFEFTETFYDLSNTYEFQHHAGGPVAIGIDQAITLQSRAAAVVDFGDDFFSPYSFSVAFDYKTAATSGDRMYFSTISDIDDGSTWEGFLMQLYDGTLTFRLFKETPGLYMNVPVNVSNLNFINDYVRLVFVFNHSFNHATGDKNNIKVYANGVLRANVDIADNSITQADRDAGVKFTNPNKIYLNRMNNAGIGVTNSFDNIKIWRDALTHEEALAVSSF